jgi:transcriptional regulator with XRE-family HTH domain
LRGLGHLLIALRIAQGVSQRELAKRLEVHESQVSRDERNELLWSTEGEIQLLIANAVHAPTPSCENSC